MVWTILVVYGLVMVGESTYENFSMNHQIAAANARIVTLENEEKDDQLDLVYYNSDAYKEIQARESLLLKGPGENVVALPVSQNEVNLRPFEDAPAQSTASAAAAPMSPLQSWWNLFFGDKKTSE
jgi:cell division protein FtsB